MTKGETVTKPIELGLKTNELSKPANLDKPASAKARKDPMIAAEQRTEADIMPLTPARSRKTNPKPEIVNQISQRLGDVYKDVLNQPVPDRFLDLLQALESGAPPKNAAAKAAADRSSAGGSKKEQK